MDQEVWYEIEVSRKDDEDWNRYGNHSFDSKRSAQQTIDKIKRTTFPNWKYQIVKVTATREVVS